MSRIIITAICTVGSLLPLHKALAQANISAITKTIAIQQVRIDELTKKLNKVTSDIENGNIHCPQFLLLSKATDGEWHPLNIQIGAIESETMGGFHGYQITASYTVEGLHSLGTWTALNSFSGASSLSRVLGDASSGAPVAGRDPEGKKLELRWGGESIRKYQLEIRSKSKVTAMNLPDRELADIRVCISPIPAMLNINWALGCQPDENYSKVEGQCKK